MLLLLIMMMLIIIIMYCNNFSGKYRAIVCPKLSGPPKDLDYTGTTVLWDWEIDLHRTT
jgi:hypothetical protein